MCADDFRDCVRCSRFSPRALRADGRRDPRARREGGGSEGLSRRRHSSPFSRRSTSRSRRAGLAHYRRHTLTKILTDEGALAKAALRFDYDPASNFIDVESIRIFRKGGGVEIVDLAARQGSLRPRLDDLLGRAHEGGAASRASPPGDAVEVKTYKKGFEIAYLAEREGGGGAGAGAPERAGGDGRAKQPQATTSATSRRCGAISTTSSISRKRIRSRRSATISTCRRTSRSGTAYTTARSIRRRASTTRGRITRGGSTTFPRSRRSRGAPRRPMSFRSSCSPRSRRGKRNRAGSPRSTTRYTRTTPRSKSS